MTKIRPRQLELPVMVDVNGKATTRFAGDVAVGLSSQSCTVDTGFHKPASADDQSIYKAISDNYFGATVQA